VKIVASITPMLAAALAGCAAAAPQVQIERADDGRRFVETFDVAYGRAKPLQAGPTVGAHDNHEIVLFAERAGESGGFSQFIRIRTFWPYREGISHTLASQMNATLDYVLAGPEGSLLYRGAGIVHVVREGGGYECFVKNADLGLTGRTGRAVDVFGLCRLTGGFRAADDRFEHDYHTRRFEPVIEHLRRTPRRPPAPKTP
jgi:hypothetical protein